MEFVDNSSETKQGNSLIWIFTIFLSISIIIGIVLTFLPKPTSGRSNKAGIPFATNNKAIRVINIYNLIEYQKMLPHVAESLKLAENSDNVIGIILRINSGGGTVGASHEIYSRIQEFKKISKKPVVALLGDIAASGGYYIACASDVIVSGPGTLTGSIGVIMNSFTFKELFSKAGIKQNIIKSGQFKDIGSAIGRDKTPEEIAILQNIVDKTFKQFFNIVLKSRKGIKNLDAAHLKRYADGRIYNGETALQIGLVDEIGGLTTAINRVKKRANIGQKEHVVIIEDQKSPLLKLLDVFNSKYSLSVPDFLQNHSYGVPLYLYVGGI